MAADSQRVSPEDGADEQAIWNKHVFNLCECAWEVVDPVQGKVARHDVKRVRTPRQCLLVYLNPHQAHTVTHHRVRLACTGHGNMFRAAEESSSLRLPG